MNNNKAKRNRQAFYNAADLLKNPLLNGHFTESTKILNLVSAS